MSATTANAMFDERVDPGRITSFVLAAAMHLALFAVLMFGVRWQNRPPEAVMVELWNEPPPVAVQVEPKPAPPPPAPPVVAKPEPVIPKPEIAEKAPPPKPAPKLAQAEPKPKPRPEPPKVAPRPRDEEAQRQIREQLNREQTSLAIDRERQQLREQLARDASAARSKTMADWMGKVAAKVRGNVVLPPEIKGNPEAVFDVVQLPNGDVLQVKLRKSSGHRALDDAIERAILKSSPLPKPDKLESAPRAFELKYRPLD